MPNLEDFLEVSKEDLEKSYIVMIHLIKTKEYLPGLMLSYGPSSFDWEKANYEKKSDEDVWREFPPAPCPFCDNLGYHHVILFNNLPTICLTCFRNIESKLEEKSLDEIKGLEEYCRNKLGNETFDQNKIK